MYQVRTVVLFIVISFLCVHYVNSEIALEDERSVSNLDFEPQVYRDYDDFVSFMENLTNASPDLASLFFLKGSVQNRNIPVLEITRKVQNSIQAHRLINSRQVLKPH
jgi:hypothetical protein